QSVVASCLEAPGFPTYALALPDALPILTAYDPYGNVATGYLGTVSISSSDSQAALPSSYAFVAGDAGVHSFAVTLKTAGTQSITAADHASLPRSQTGIVVQPPVASALKA